MNRLICIGSGSSGNGYLLECGNEILVLECGLPIKKYLESCNYNIRDWNACIVSHRHIDHASYIKDFIKRGISVYSCLEVQSVYPNVKVLKKGLKRKIGGFKVQPIPLQHNCECYGYLIEHELLGRLVFCTDTANFPYHIKNVNHWLIEANYSNDIEIENACKGMESHSASQNHMEINSTIEALKRNFSVETQTIVLLHLSNSNSNEKEFKKSVQNALGFENVKVAQSGLIVELNKEEF